MGAYQNDDFSFLSDDGADLFPNADTKEELEEELEDVFERFFKN